MKKRIACLVLALVMLVGLVPLSAVKASAASYGYSNAGIRVIKDFVGFHKNAYESNGNYYIGYGTPSVKGATITEAKADTLLRKELNEIAAKVQAAIGIELVQHRVDALIWYTFVEGDSWLTSSNAAAFRAAVQNGVGGSDLADKMCTWNYDVNGFDDSEYRQSVIKRRMSMANLYLNGTYSATAKGSLAYTVLDAGKKAEALNGNRQIVQVYVSSRMTAPKVNNPTKGSQKFLGWYKGDKMITSLSSATAGKTLTAKWQKDGHSVEAEYKLPAELIYIASGMQDNVRVYVYEQPYEDPDTVINVLNRDNTVKVVGEKMIGDIKWLKLSTGGWVKLGKLDDIPVSLTDITVTVNDDYVNLRRAPKATSTKLGTAKRGEKLNITMISSDGSWGYSSKGWVFLAYTSYTKNSAPSTGNGVSDTVSGTPGVVTGAARVNVRKGAGVSNALATTLAEGTAVTVYERKTVDGAPWGRIDQGWISLGYVKLQEVQKPADGSGISAGSSAVVSSSVSLNVRSGPGTTYNKVTTLAPGTSVVILRKETVNGATWGLIDQGWINLSYVTATGSSSGSGSSSVYSVGGTVVNCSTGVNIRAAAGTTNALVGVAGVGTRVNVTDIKTVGGFKWGKIETGWVCMDYIQLDSEFKKPTVSKPTVEDEPSNVVELFQGYPAVTDERISLLETAAHHANALLTLDSGVKINILAWTQSGTNLYGKVTVGDKTGWVDMSKVTMEAYNAKVTASKADVYEEPSTRSKFYASLTKSTYITVPVGKNPVTGENTNWKISDGALWGKITTIIDGVTYNGWINLSNVTMFKGNETPSGITTYSGAGYLTGKVKADSTVYEDSNGNVSATASAYTLTKGTKVNILARNYTGTKTYGKVSVGSVTGWVDMANISLYDVTFKASKDVDAFGSAANAAANTNPVRTIAKGKEITITTRMLMPNTNEINHGVIDVGLGYVGDNTSKTYYFVMDNGKLTPAQKATVESPSNPMIASSVVLTGKAKGDVYIREDTIDSTDPGKVNLLLQISGGSPITVLNWRNVDGITWGKVQVNKVVGWVKSSEVDFGGLKGKVAVDELKLYNLPDLTSAVQVLRVNAKPIEIQTDDIVLSGNILWGKIKIDDTYIGWADLSKLTLNTPGIIGDPGTGSKSAIAKGKINSINTTATLTNGDVVSLPKGTEVSLIQLDMTGTGKAFWLVDLGDKDGWVDMDYVNMYSAIATVTESKLSIYDDTTCAKELYTLYRDEKITVQSFYVKQVTYGAELYGEVAYGNTTGWILLCDQYDKMFVSLRPGSTGTVIGGGSGSGSTGTGSGSTTPTTPTTPAADPIPAYIVCNTSVNVRSGAGVDQALIGTLANGTNVKIYEKSVVLGKEWARIDQGWVCMDYVRLGTLTNVPNGGTNGGSGTQAIITTVPSGAIAVGYANQDIKVRTGSNMGYPEVGTVKKGASIAIYENKLDGGMSWGRTDNGWVCTSYLTITGIGVPGSGNMGTIGGVGFTANVRNSASSNGALMAKVMVSSRVVVRETTAVGAETWGRTDLGWINMQYIVMDSAAAPVPGTPAATTPVETAPTEAGIIEVG